MINHPESSTCIAEELIVARLFPPPSVEINEEASARPPGRTLANTSGRCGNFLHSRDDQSVGWARRLIDTALR